MNVTQKEWTELNKQGVINTHKLIKDAIEKTNKRWRERVGIWLKRMKLECDVVVCDCGSKLKDWDMANIVDKALSDLLEDK